MPILRDITPEQYFAECCPAPALTNSGMDALLNKTPADFAHAHPALNADPEVRKASLAMRLGDVTHQLALGKGKGYAIIDHPDFKSKAAKEARDAAIADKLTPITAPKFAEAEKMADILRARIRAEIDAYAVKCGQEPGLPYETELVFTWQEQGPHGPIWCRGMLDVWCEPLMLALDPKITPRLYGENVKYHMENMGWDRQGAWYQRGLETIFPEEAGRVRFADLMVNPEPPYVFRAVEIGEAWRTSIQPDIDFAVNLFGKCLHENHWPGYEPGIETFEPTPRKVRRAMEAMMEETE